MVPHTATIRPVDAAGDCCRKIAGRCRKTAEPAGKPPELVGKSELAEFAGIHRIFHKVHPVEADRASDAVGRRIRGSRHTHDRTLTIADCRRREDYRALVFSSDDTLGASAR